MGDSPDGMTAARLGSNKYKPFLSPALVIPVGESPTGTEGVRPGERVLTYLALNRRQAILSFLPPSVSSFTRLPGPTPFSDPFLGVWLDSISGGVVPETKS
jgi:hypothetical protein